MKMIQQADTDVNPHTPPRGGVRSIGEICCDFAVRVFESERHFVAAGWFQPVQFHDLAYEFGLSGLRYGDCDAGLIHSYLWAVAENGAPPSMRGCIDVVGRAFGVILDTTWIYSLVMDADVHHDHIRTYAIEVAKLCDIRERFAKKYTTDLGRLLIDTDQYEFLVRLKDPPVGPARNGKSRKATKYV